MSALEDEQQLTNLTQDEFVARLAHYYCEIFVLHPFRAGNGRTQRIFFEQLALHAGYLLTWISWNEKRGVPRCLLACQATWHR